MLVLLPRALPCGANAGKRPQTQMSPGCAHGVPRSTEDSTRSPAGATHVSNTQQGIIQPGGWVGFFPPTKLSLKFKYQICAVRARRKYPLACQSELSNCCARNRTCDRDLWSPSPPRVLVTCRNSPNLQKSLHEEQCGHKPAHLSQHHTKTEPSS